MIFSIAVIRKDLDHENYHCSMRLIFIGEIIVEIFFQRMTPPVYDF